MNKFSILATAALVFLLTSTLKAQWGSFYGLKSNYASICDFRADKFVKDDKDSLMMMVGRFDTINGSQFAGGALFWDGKTISYYPHRSDSNIIQGFGTYPVQSAVYYKGKFYVSGNEFKSFRSFDIKTKKWSGETPIYRQNPDGTYKVAGSIYRMKVIEDTLYFVGHFDSIAGIKSRYVIKYDGQNWYRFNAPDFNREKKATTKLYDIAKYKGKFYVIGFFYNDTDSNNVLNTFAVLNNGRWENVAEEFVRNRGGFADYLEVYDNNLYISGYFYENGGASGNCIMSWDGTSFNRLGNGLGGQPLSLRIIENKLYVVGKFDVLDHPEWGFACTAIWDGSQWSKILEESDYGNGTSGIYDIIKSNSNILISGSFCGIKNVEAIGLAMNSNVQSIKELESTQAEISAYPNPVSTELNIQVNNQIPISKLRIYAVNGTLVKKQNLENPNLSTKLDLSELSNGLYFMKIDDIRGNEYSLKLSVQH